MRAGLRALAAGLLAAACLVQRPPPDRAPPTGVHEVKRTAYPDGSPKREFSVLVWSDGRTERDGREREFHPSGALAAERTFSHERPSGVWRTWYFDGTPRSEIDFGEPGSGATRVHRFWHENGQLAAEGPAVEGIREGVWSYWTPQGTLERRGGYQGGKRDGPWTFYASDGAKRAEGRYALGARVGSWTLWDEAGVPHASAPADVEEPEEP